MIKKKITTVLNWLEDGLRSLSGQITPDGRIVIILIMLFLFSAGSVYMTVSSIYNMGKKSGRQMQIEHIERLKFHQKQETDSINHKKEFYYE